MAATLVTLTDSDVFHSGGSSSGLVSIPEVDNIVGKEGLAIYNTVAMRLPETLQYFLTFDDVIKFIHFGKGLGEIQVEGTMFCDGAGDLPGINKYSAAIKGLRGKEQKISIGDIVVTAILTQSNVTVVGDPDTRADFSFSFAIVNHEL